MIKGHKRFSNSRAGMNCNTPAIDQNNVYLVGQGGQLLPNWGCQKKYT